MPHQDHQDVATNLQALKAVFETILPPEMDHFVRHGNATIKPVSLAAIAITCWGWTLSGTLDERMATAHAVVKRVLGVGHKTVSRQGMMNALATCGGDLIELIVAGFVSQLSQLKSSWTHGGKVNLAVDGSKFSAPRTAANQSCFAANARKRAGKTYAKRADHAKARTVQLLVTVFWHLGSGMPVRWRVNQSSGSERNDVRQMLTKLPPATRLIGDAEYVGYPLWSAIIESRKSFLFRVGSNVRLLKHLGRLRIRDGYVYYWPARSMRDGLPPIVLRLIKIHTGKKAIYLVSNELDMTDELACQLYRQRWGIEVFFRSVKQSCQRSKLCCCVPQNVTTELNWTLIGIWAAMFTGKKCLQDQQLSPHRLSPVKVIRAFYATTTALAIRAVDAPLLVKLLRNAILADESNRTRPKSSRTYPRKKKHKRCGKPKILQATITQKRNAKSFLQ